jgi:hypothetical protein
MVHIAPTTSNVNAVMFAKLFLHCVVRLHGVPLSIVSDRGAQFAGTFTRALLALLGTKQHLSTSFHPQTDGQTERANRYLEDMLRHYVSPLQNDWDEHLDMAEFAINNTWQSSVRQSPFFLNYGLHPLTPLSAQVQASMTCVVPAAAAFATTMHELAAVARVRMRQAQERQKRTADAHRRDLNIPVGAPVLLNSKHLALKLNGTRKLMPKFIGPFTVLRKVGHVAYQLALGDTLKVHNVFHVSLLRPYRCDGPPPPPPRSFILEGAEHWNVELILKHRPRGRKTEFLCQWEGFGPEHNSWEPEDHLSHCAGPLAAYWHLVRGRDTGPAPGVRPTALS